MSVERREEVCEKADMIAAAYGDRYDWADPDALMLYFRLELVNDVLREVAAKVHESIMPGAKGWTVAVLRALYLAPEHRLSHAEIANQTRVPPANVTYHVDVLQQGGYVNRVPHETDRRVMRVQLTPTGLDLCERLIPARAELITKLGTEFTQDEKQLFNAFLSRLMSKIDRDGSPGG